MWRIWVTLLWFQVMNQKALCLSKISLPKAREGDDIIKFSTVAITRRVYLLVCKREGSKAVKDIGILNMHLS